MNRFLVALLVALPLSILGAGYMLISGHKAVASLMVVDPDLSHMTEGQLYYLFFAAFSLAPFVFGLISALVWGWLDSIWLFRGLALGLAVVMTVAAIAQRTPMLGIKVVANFGVALAFGWLLPLLANP